MIVWGDLHFSRQECGDGGYFASLAGSGNREHGILTLNPPIIWGQSRVRTACRCRQCSVVANDVAHEAFPRGGRQTSRKNHDWWRELDEEDDENDIDCRMQ